MARAKPSREDLTGASGYGATAPVYPVAKLVKALEELREELGKRRVVIFAEGATGWIAERYAVRHAKRTAGLIILNGYLDKVPLDEVAEWEKGFLQYVQDECRELWQKITDEKKLTDEVEAGLKQAASTFRDRYAKKKEQTTAAA